MIVNGSINHTFSGRKRNNRRATNKRGDIKLRPWNMPAGPVRRYTEQIASARCSGHNTEVVEPKIASNATIAPAYNKGAYQVISKENIKDIGR